MDTLSAAKQNEKNAFAKRLKLLMNRKGWHQSELARQAKLPRDSISVYLRARSLPTFENRKALAAALGVTVDELMETPNPVSRPVESKRTITASGSDSVELRIHQNVSARTAIKIMELLELDAQEVR